MKESNRFYFKRLVFFLILVPITMGRAQSIKVGTNTILDLGLSNKILTENQSYSTLENTDRILLSGMYVDADDPTDYRCFSTFSANNGKTWTKPFITPYRETADPWGVITPKGNLLFSSLGYLPNSEALTIFLFRSEDDGKTWVETPALIGNFDHQTMVVDPVKEIIYLVAVKDNNIYVNVSMDDGMTFQYPYQFKYNNLNTNTLVPVVNQEGKLLLSFSNFSRSVINGSRPNRPSERLAKSLNYLIAFDPQHGFETPKFICDSCENGFPTLAIDDTASSYNGNLYYVCSSQSDNTIYFHYSNTQGNSWSLPIPIKTYHHKLKEDRSPFTGIPQVAVTKNGTIGIIWQDRTDDPDGLCNKLYFTSSNDGGLTFLDPVVVSTQASCMERPENLWAGQRYRSGGDYISLIPTPKGFKAIWADSRDGISQYYQATLDLE